MLRVYLYGGPGTGKSTTAAIVFALLKQTGRNVELVTEYAKDLTWEQAHPKLAFQPYIVSKQMWRMQRLEGQVEAAISDSSPLLGLLFGEPTAAFRGWVVDDYERHETLNIFLRRNERRRYNPAGRNQTEAEATSMDDAIERLLRDVGASFHELRIDLDGAHARPITESIDRRLSAMGFHR